MMNYRNTLGMGALIVLLLAGCGSNEQTAETTASPSATPSASMSPSPTTSPSPGNKAMKENAERGKGNPEFAPLHKIVGSTEAAVKAGDFAKAKAEFAQFDPSWHKVEDGVKAKSSDTYNEVEAKADEVTGELKAAKPQRDKLITALKTLNKEVWKAEKAK